MRVAAVALEPKLGDVAENLRRCRELGDRAAAAGADWIVLPEFFPTGMGFYDQLANAALPANGAGIQLLLDLATRHGAVTAGSFICRDDDGDNRNAWFLVSPDGSVLGRHDKDVPTMWENCFYIGGTDNGLLECDGHSVGAAMCWELMRSRTARRLRGRVDLLVAGSAWWSIPQWPPRRVTQRMQATNSRTAGTVAPEMARAVGAPMVHAALCGPLSCGMPLVPGVTYQGHFQGGACVTDGRGGLLAWRSPEDGPGVAVADIEPGRTHPTLKVDDAGYWLHRRGALPTAAWGYQNPHGRGWYRRHARHRPPKQGSLSDFLTT